MSQPSRSSCFSDWINEPPMADLDKHRTREQEVITSRTSPPCRAAREVSLGLAKYFQAANERLNYLEYGDPAEYLLRTQGLEVPNSPLDGIWIPPRFKQQDEVGDDIALNTLLGDASPCLLVLADPGCGKSTLARFLTCFFINRFCNSEQDYFGLLVPLSTLRTSGMTYQEAVAHCAADYVGLDRDSDVVDAVRKQMSRACVIFDGLDELPIVQRTFADGEEIVLRGEAARLIRALRYVQTPDAQADTPRKCLVTSRSKDYFDDRESSLGTVPHYFISRFSPDQMNRAVRHWHKAARARVAEYTKDTAKILKLLDERERGIHSALREHFDLATVCLTPLMLSALQTVYSDAKDLPSSVSQLCWRAISWFLVDKHLGTSQKAFVGVNGPWLLQTITDIGWYSHQRMVAGLSKSFTDTELRQLTRSACPLKEVMRADYETQENAITGVASFLRRGHGILVKVSHDEFDFVHNVFREVMAGRAL